MCVCACAAHIYTTLPFRFLGNVDGFENAAKSLLQLNLKIRNQKSWSKKHEENMQLFKIKSYIRNRDRLDSQLNFNYDLQHLASFPGSLRA